MADEQNKELDPKLLDQFRKALEVIPGHAEQITVDLLQIKTARQEILDAQQELGLSVKDLVSQLSEAGIEPMAFEPEAMLIVGDKAIPLGATTGKDGVVVVDTTTAQKDGVMVFAPSGKNASAKATMLTAIDGGDPNAERPAKLAHVGADISFWTQNGYAESKESHLAVSLADSARVHMNEKLGTEFEHGIATIERVQQFNTSIANELIALGDPESSISIDPAQNSGKETITGKELQRRLVQVADTIEPGDDTMEALQRLTGVLSSVMTTKLDTPEAQETAFARVHAYMPTLVALINHRVNLSEPAGEFSFLTAEQVGDDLANFNMNRAFLQMVGTEEPTAEQLELMDRFGVLHKDHSQNASTSTAINTHTADTDFWQFINNGIGTLRGARHGGANIMVLHDNRRIFVLEPDEIRESSVTEIRNMSEEELAKREEALADRVFSDEELQAKADAYIDVFLEGKKNGVKEKLNGIGHRVYKMNDPRGDESAEPYQKLVDSLGDRVDQRSILGAKILERANAEPLLGGRGLNANIDYTSGHGFKALGFDENLFTPLFAMWRAGGWTAQAVECMVPEKQPDGTIIAVPDSIFRPYDTILVDELENPITNALATEAEAAGQSLDDFKASIVAKAASGNEKPDPTKPLDDVSVYQMFQKQQSEERVA